MDRRRQLKFAAGHALAIGGLLWVLHDVNPRRIAEAATVHHWSWVFVAIAADIGSYISQAVRWRMLLAPAGELSTLQALQAIYAGLFVNEIAPLRFGEVVRAYLASRWLSLRIRTVIPSLAVERLMDAVWLALAVGISAEFVPLPAGLVAAAETLGLLVILATIVLLIFAGESLRRMRQSTGFWSALVVSSQVLILQTLAFWMVMRAYDLPLRFGIGAVVFLIVHLGTAIPNAPANVGSYQFFTVVGLTFFGVDKTLATGFSIGVFVILTAPLWAIGLVALMRTGMTLQSIRGEIGRSYAGD
jgi:hypothetical protein